MTIYSFRLGKQLNYIRLERLNLRLYTIEYTSAEGLYTIEVVDFPVR